MVTTIDRDDHSNQPVVSLEKLIIFDDTPGYSARVKLVDAPAGLLSKYPVCKQPFSIIIGVS